MNEPLFAARPPSWVWALYCRKFRASTSPGGRARLRLEETPIMPTFAEQPTSAKTLEEQP